MKILRTSQKQEKIHNKLAPKRKIIVNFISTKIEWIPLNSVDVKEDKRDGIIEFLETLEDDEDVQNVFSNFKLGDN